VQPPLARSPIPRYFIFNCDAPTAIRGGLLTVAREASQKFMHCASGISTREPMGSQAGGSARTYFDGDSRAIRDLGDRVDSNSLRSVPPVRSTQAWGSVLLRHVVALLLNQRRGSPGRP